MSLNAWAPQSEHNERCLHYAILYRALQAADGLVWNVSAYSHTPHRAAVLWGKTLLHERQLPATIYHGTNGTG